MKLKLNYVKLLALYKCMQVIMIKELFNDIVSSNN